MIKQILAAAGFGLGAYVVYQAYGDYKNSKDDNKSVGGSFMNVALGLGESVTGAILDNVNDDMATSILGINFIRSYEGGFKKYPYFATEKEKLDGKYTIGYGTTFPASMIEEFEGGISELEAASLMLEGVSVNGQQYSTGINPCETAIINACKVKLTQNQFDALVSIRYNAGNVRKLVKMINEGNISQVGQAIKTYNIAAAPVGLGNRRRDEFEIWDKADYLRNY